MKTNAMQAKCYVQYYTDINMATGKGYWVVSAVPIDKDDTDFKNWKNIDDLTKNYLKVITPDCPYQGVIRKKDWIECKSNVKEGLIDISTYLNLLHVEIPGEFSLPDNWQQLK